MLGYGERAGRDCDTFDGQENTELGIFLVQYHSSYGEQPHTPALYPLIQCWKLVMPASFSFWPLGHGPMGWLLTKFGHPKPWDKDEVHVYVAKL
jgi:hypothetical protein